MAFDGIVLKAIASELQQLSGARVDKIFQPTKNNVVIGLYLNGYNYALNICTDSQNYRLHLTTHSKANPKIAPNFCMVLRKHLLGLHIKNIITNNLERIVTIEFEGFDDIDDIIQKKLILEFMGKHCNIILLDESNVIIDSLRHISQDDISFRNILPHVKYSYPVATKCNFLEISNFDCFKNSITIPDDISELPTTISNTFNGISKSFIQHSIEKLKLYEINDYSMQELYNYIVNIISHTDNNDLYFETIKDKAGNFKDYSLILSSESNNFALNFYLDDFYYQKETSEDFKVYRDSVLKLILSTLKKYTKRLYNINDKLNSCENAELYKLYGELIMANLYRIKDENLNEIQLENYYDNNSLITIPLNPKYNISYNAKLYFKKYRKSKNALDVVSIQKSETLRDLDYIESVIFELENCYTLSEVSSVFEEISESDIFKEKTDSYKNKKNEKIKKSKLTNNKNVNFNPIKYTIDDYTFLVGRNNKENDYLTLKYAKNTDIWFHTQDIHGSHAILMLDQKPAPSIDTLIKCAKIVALHSKAKNSSNVPVDYCEVRYVKKPNGAKPGMVIYTHQKTLHINPKK